MCVLVPKLCLTLCAPMNGSPPGSPVHRISQARILEWVAISFSRGSSWPRDLTLISCIGRQILYHWAACDAFYLLYSWYTGWKTILIFYLLPPPGPHWSICNSVLSLNMAVPRKVLFFLACSLGMLSCFSHVWFFVTSWTASHQAPLWDGILQARILEWVAMPSSRGYSVELYFLNSHVYLEP